MKNFIRYSVYELKTSKATNTKLTSFICWNVVVAHGLKDSDQFYIITKYCFLIHGLYVADYAMHCNFNGHNVNIKLLA